MIDLLSGGWLDSRHREELLDILRFFFEDKVSEDLNCQIEILIFLVLAADLMLRLFSL
jgi:hypothetical protein